MIRSFRRTPLLVAAAYMCQILILNPIAYSQASQTMANFGSVNTGSTSSATTLTFTFGEAETLGSISVLTMGANGLDFANAGTGSCAAGTSYSAGSSCTVNATFTPSLAGVRLGAAVLEDGSGKVIATGYLQGAGIGPQVNFLPGTEVSMPTSALSQPSGVAVNGGGNIYIVDTYNNRVLKETISAGSYTESTVPTSGLSGPSGIAVDGSGNVYIADTYNNRVLIEIQSAGGYTEAVVQTSALNQPHGVAVDGSGNLYIADTNNNRVLKEVLSGDGYTESAVPTSTLAYPSGVAVDGNGNIYIADTGNSRILLETLSEGSYTESAVSTSALTYPGAVTVDGRGNLFIADSGNNRVLKETPSGGTYFEGTVQTGTLNYPSGVTADGNGNLYITDTGNNRELKEDFADAPSLSFASTAPGSTSSDSPQTVTVENIGNATLNFPIPGSGTNPAISTNFTLNSSGASACPLVSGSTTAGTLAAGQTCLLPVSFAPSAAGSLSGTLALTDNALNAAAPGYGVQTITLNGIGTGNTEQSITFGAIGAQTANSTIALTAMGSSGLPVSFTATTPTICTISGSTASLLAAGACTIQATQSGSVVYAAAPAVTQSFTVNLAAQTITFNSIPAQVINASVPVALAASASSGLPVSFASTTPTVCTASTSNSTATLLSVGTCTIQASQAGDGVVYAAASTVMQSFAVTTANPLTGTNFGSVNIGSTSSTTTLTFTFNTAETLGTVSVLTQGAVGLDFANAGTGACTVGTSYSAGGSCTVNVTFAPTLAGARYGAVVLGDNSGNVIATDYLQGTGAGPQVSFLPGVEISVPTSALNSPSGIAVDGSGNVYIADMNNNRLLKETLSAGTYVESTVPTSVLAYPSGVAVDGSGNVYIADTYNNRVLEEAPSEGSYVESVIPTSALNQPAGVAVDGNGNIYIADTSNNRVLMEMLSAGGYTESTVPTSFLSLPAAVAVDGNGNVYIADTYDNRVLVESLSAGSYTESTVSSTALTYPGAVAVDGVGNIYISDTGNNRVLKETPYGGSYIESTASASSMNQPLAVAVDGIGDIYIADTFNNRVLKEDFKNPPSLSFASTAPGSTSSDSPQTVTIENIGNAILNFPVPSSGTNPIISTNFSLYSSVSSACPFVNAGSTAGTLSAGQSCLLPISFTPSSSGAFSGALLLSDNALNATASQSIALNGTGTGATSQSITFGSIGAQSADSTLSLTATATSGLPVSLSSSTPSICTVSGSTASLLAAGTCTIQATQSGNAVYTAASAVTQSFAVNLAAQTITFNPIPTQIINAAVPVGLTALATSGLAVNFTSTTPRICAAASSNSTATLLSVGTCTIQASQAGDGVVYAAAATATQSFTVTTANPLTAANFGSVNVGSTSSPIALTFTFGTTETLGSISVVTQGAVGLDFANAGTGTCGVGSSYSAGASCAVNVTFTPTLAGTRIGATVLEDSSGNVIATGYVQGTGSGPQLIFLPSTEGTVSTSTLSFPSAIAIDGNGNLYIADTYNNRVLEERISAGTYSEIIIPINDLSSPTSVAVDGGGNVYVADSDNDRIVKIVLSRGTYTESTITSSALNQPSAVAVDGSGNVYIADTYNNRVLLETLSGGIYTESTVPSSDLAYPSGLTVDGSGNVYIVDTYNNRVLKETISSGGYTEKTVPAVGLTYPGGVAVDDIGNVYIADTNNSRVLKETLSGGTYTESTVSASALNYPSGVSVDGSGNVYIADTYNNRILKEDFANPPSLSFAATAPGSTSSDSPQTVTVENIGNVTLNFPVPGSGNNPGISTNFSLNSSVPSACPLVNTGSTEGTLAAGQICLLPVSFAPSAAGVVSGALLLTDDALNAAAPGYASQSITLSGISTGATAQSITFGSIGTQTANSTLSLSATATSGLPVSLSSSTPIICTVSGSTASLLAAGTCTIQAMQSGNPEYAAASAVTQSFPVNLAAQTVAFDAIPTQMINATVPVALTALASSGLAVTFTSTTPTICTASSSNSTATLLAVGTCTVQASQAGDGVVYATATTITQSFTVTSANPLTATNFGSVNIGSTSLATALTFTFSTAETLGSISVLTQGATGLDFANAATGTCAVGSSYSAGASCTVKVTFTPTLAGTRYGAAVLQDSSGNVFATDYVQGSGSGPQVTFLPGTEVTVSTSSLNFPVAVAVDGSGNLYIADTYNNRVLKETLSEGSYSESVLPLASVLADPRGVAVDGSGSVYIADTNNNRVLKETLSAGSYIESTVPTSALSQPQAVAADGSGNLYIADSGNQRVLMETLNAGTYNEIAIPTSSLALPASVAVDGVGNIYIADAGNNSVLKETLSAGTYFESSVPTTALNDPSGVMVDSGGNLYIADSGNNRVLKEALSSGTYTESAVSTSALLFPTGLAVDGNGNIYVADSDNERLVKEDLVDPPSLSFAPTAPGSTSIDSPQTVTLENVGNTALSIPSLSGSYNPWISTNFSVSTTGPSACPQASTGSSAGTILAGHACYLPISFSPSEAGAVNGALTLTNNSLNAAAPSYTTQVIALNGIGTGSTAQSITFASISAQSVNATVALTASASSGLAITFTSTTPGACTVSGSTAAMVSVGTCTILATQAGSAEFAAAPVAGQSVTVNLNPQTITLNPISTQILETSATVALTATATSGLPVSFVSTSPSVCTVPSGSSTISLFTLGTCTIQAIQAGDGVIFAAASTVTESFTVISANALTATNFGSVNVRTTSAAMTLTFTFSAAETLGSVSVLTQGATGLDFADVGTGTCAAGTSYNIGDGCTVNAAFSPILAGPRYGAVVLADDTGNMIATSYLQGLGAGPQITFLPGTESTVSASVLDLPSAVAVDSSGNLYIADTYNNRVLKETLSAGSYTESTVASRFGSTNSVASPYGVAVDGSGDIYIADYGSNSVRKETPSGAGYIESTVPTSTLTGPRGVAVDGSGNIYVADSYNGRILMESLSAGGYTESAVPTGALYPYAVAVDGYGNIYIADANSNKVFKETRTAGSYTESIVPTSRLDFPAGLAIDGNGSVYIADTYNSRVLKEQLSGGSYTENVVPSSSLTYPSGVAVDGGGNVYIVDTYNNRILKEDFADPPSLSFAPTAPGSTSSDSPQTVTVVNVGNASLNFPVPGSGSNPGISTNFSLNSSVPPACPLVNAGATAGTLAAGQSCLLPISFAPTSAGTLSGTLALSDNALNAVSPSYASQSIALNGIGTGSTSQTISFDAVGAQFVNTTVGVTTTATSGLPVSVSSSTPTICAVSGSTVSLLTLGTCTLEASQLGDSIYAAAPPVAQSFLISLSTQTITFSPIPPQLINNAVPVALTASATSYLPISFTSTTPSICTVSSANSTATLLTSGTCTILATQAGDGIAYAPAVPITQSFAVESANVSTGTTFGSVNIGGSGTSITLTFTLNSAETLGNVSVVTQGATGLDFVNAGTGTCAAETDYSAGASCTVNVTFVPTLAGTRFGAAMLEDNDGNVIAINYLQGVGVGPQVTFLPGTENIVSTSTLNNPQGIAIDGAGDLYIADTYNNRVLKETLSAGSYTESTVPTSTLNSPAGIALDGNGAIYIADSANNRILIETPSSGSYVESTILTSSLNQPQSVAVDGSGNVYIADSGNQRILLETWVSAGNYTEEIVPTGYLSWPAGVAVDGSGNIYIVDSNYQVVLKETLSAGDYTESTLPTDSLFNPSGISVDGNGNLYIADTSNNRVLKEAFLSGSYTESVLGTSSLSSPLGAAVDGSGNVYIADTFNQRILKEDFADPPSLTFASTAIGTTSSDSPQTVTLENSGNATLLLPIPGSGTNASVTANFGLSSSTASACPLVASASSAAGTLFPGRSCLLFVTFTPTTADTLTGTLTVTDNALNAAAPGFATQSIALNGTGTGGAPQVIVFKPIPDQRAHSSIALAATASSGLQVSFTSATPATCSISGTSALLVAAGTCAIQANQSGDRTFVAAAAVSRSFSVHPDQACGPANTGVPSYISSVSPSGWFAGQTFTVTIKGHFTGNSHLAGCTYDEAQVITAFETLNTGFNEPLGTDQFVTISNVQFRDASTMTATVQVDVNAHPQRDYLLLTCDGCVEGGDPVAPVYILPVPEIQLNGNTISGANPPQQSGVAGQQIHLTTKPLTLPFTTTGRTNAWIMGKPTIGNYTHSDDGTHLTKTQTDQDSITFYWVEPDHNISVKYRYCVSLADSSQVCSPDATALYGIIAGPVGVTLDISDQSTGIITNPWRANSRIQFRENQTALSQPGGAFRWIQIVQSDDLTLNFDDGTSQVCKLGPGLDTSDPYPYGYNEFARDSPKFPLGDYGDETEVIGNIRFKMYLMWDSGTASSVWVPLGFVLWNVFTDSSKDPITGVWSFNTDNPASVTNSLFVPSTAFSDASEMFPQWNGPPLTNIVHPQTDCNVVETGGN